MNYVIILKCSYLEISIPNINLHPLIHKILALLRLYVSLTYPLVPANLLL